MLPKWQQEQMRLVIAARMQTSDVARHDSGPKYLRVVRIAGGADDAEDVLMMISLAITDVCGCYFVVEFTLSTIHSF